MKRTITLFTILLLCAVSLFAQAPEKFSYQAVVRNASNSLVTDAQVGVRVSILQGDANGNAVYVETHTAATNANGLLTVEIGGGKAEQGSFAGIDWANGPYFLKTETDPNGGSDYGVTITQQLLSVPYALYAREAANSFSGDYNDLRNLPEIPQVPSEISAFTNDVGYITKSDLPESSKGGDADDGLVQTTVCGEIDLCEMMNQLNQLAQQQSQLEQMRTVLLPTVTTGAVSDITETTASCGGTVTGKGYSSVTGRGVCWGTEPNPTVEGSHTSDGTGTGAFTGSLTGLVANTTYYVRAYATNSIGTAYGEDVTFTTFSTPADAQPCPNTPTVTDGDGNVYNTVLIGAQCWMRQNLRTTKKADGTAIPAGGSNTSTTAPYYYNYSGSSIPLNERGYLYNWPAAMEACPAGWHLPSDAEWTQLTEYVKGQSEYVCDGDAANIAKALASTSRWSSTSTACAVGNGQESNNATGFSAVPAGRCDGSSFRSSGLVVHYWSSTEISTAVYERYLHYKSAEVSRSNPGKAEGFSVRCLRDGSPVVDEKSCPGTSTVTDGDGNIYSTVQIGEQCWMRQNLRTTKYADGTAIPAGGSSSSNTTPYYYDYSSSDIPLSERGYLYNWTAAIVACPEGWHLPDDAEWTQLENYVKSQSGYVCGNNTGYIAKALASEARWNSSSVACSPGNQTVYANNATGFSAIAAGRCDGSSYRYSGSYALFWSSTVGGTNTRAWGRNLLSDDATVKRNDNSSKSYGRSVRCLRDGTPSGGDNPSGGDTLNTPVVDEKSCSGTPTVTDHEGNVYATVQIGNQCWMRDNLRTTHYADGSSIPAGGSNESDTIPYYYDYSSSGIPLVERGYLYNWPAAMHGASSSSAVPSGVQGVCPNGWHLPSSAEWATLSNYVISQSEYICDVYGNDEFVYAKVLASNTRWNSNFFIVDEGDTIYFSGDCDVCQNMYANNATGFSAVPAGSCYGSSFNNAGSIALFWSSEEHSSVHCNAAFWAQISCVWPDLYVDLGCKTGGFSVRCLRDETSSTPVVDEKSCTGTPTVTDHEGNVYATVQIGQQCWMRENLRTMKKADGTAIPAGGSNSSNTTPYYYDYSSSDIPLSERGYLYNWTAAIVACPEGWHLPSDAEWTQLENYVKSQSGYVCGNNTGYIAKALASEARWNSSSVACSPGNQTVYANNATGFSAIAAGRCDGSSYRYSGSYALFWSSTEGDNSNRAWGRNLLSDDATVKRNDNTSKSYGRSVRCLRDGTPSGGDAPVDAQSCPGTPTVTDHEGNVYATVQIGNQCWMRDNLRTTTSPSTGTYLIPNSSANTYTGKQARWHINDSATYAPMNYGLLYNWNAAVDTFNTAYGETSVNTSSSNAVSVTFSGHRRGICPVGWHLPSDAEWTTLTNYMGSQSEYVCGNNTSYIAKALAFTTGWHYDAAECEGSCTVATNQSANNASGFGAVPVGYYYGWDDGFLYAGLNAYFWSATQGSSSHAYYRGLDYGLAYVGRGSSYLYDGFSVRCLRD